jgi:hypothetical protein
MQVPRFSPRIFLIEMAPRAAPRSGCPGCPTLPYLSPHTYRQTDRQTPLLLLYIGLVGARDLQPNKE